jgi:pantetheine-phosphate adenylyltransferase
MKVLIPGSFDPVTTGHADIIRRAAALFGEVTACIFVNTEKRNSGMFTYQQRMELLRLVCSEIKGANADMSDMLVADYAEKGGYSAIVKGIRGASDIDYELMIADVNLHIWEGAETLFLPSPAEYARISSTAVRELIKYRLPLNGWVPEIAAGYIRGLVDSGELDI